MPVLFMLSFLAVFFTSFWPVSALPTDSVTAAKVAGCGKSLFLRGVPVNRKVANDRTYWYQIPLDYDKNRQYPVVLGFHGSSKLGGWFDGLAFAADSKLSSSKYSKDKIVVYPNGKGGVWAGPSYGIATVEEDLEFVQHVLQDLENTMCVDTNRIYATGHSNGGGFVDTIACSPVSEYFAAFASASGSFYTQNSPVSTCKPGRLPVPMLEFHGGDDSSVPYAGGQGEGGILPAIPDWLSWWAKRNGCSAENPPVNTFNDLVHFRSWSCSGKTNLLQHYLVDDMGHVWPSTEINFSSLADGKGPTYIDASKIIMEFFAQWTKNE